MKPSYRLFALRTSVQLSLAAIAATSFSFSTQAAENLDTVTVTANRMASDSVLASNTVITHADIERLQVNDLPSLLALQPSIDVTRSGGFGTQTSIFMRGTNSSHTLILVDGVKWYSATTGASALQNFPVEQIERIEIVRGPRSGLYGSEAIGGVIQIFTRKGQQGVKPYAKVSYGTHNSKQAAVGVAGGNDSTRYNLSFNHDSTDGINSFNDEVVTNPDRDGYRNNSVNLSLDHSFTDKFDVQLSLLRAETNNDYDRVYSAIFAPNAETESLHSESVQQVLSTTLNYQFTDTWLSSLTFGESRDESESYTEQVKTSNFNTRRRHASLNNIIDINSDNKLNIGFDYDVDDVDGSTTYNETSRDNKAVYAGWQGQAGSHSWLVSARHDDNEAFGSENTGMAEWGYWLTDELQVVANAGTGFKAPTFNDLYWPSLFGFQGNPDLKPETSRSFELGLVGKKSWGTWSTRVYETKIDDMIVITSDFSTMENVNKAKIRGAELEVATTVFGWNTQSMISFVKPEDEESKTILSRRAQRLASFTADKQWGDWSTGMSWKLRGHSYNDAANTTRLGGYGLVDLRVAYQIDTAWQLATSMNNVFDKEYETVDTYNSLDRTVMLTLSYQP